MRRHRASLAGVAVVLGLSAFAPGMEAVQDGTRLVVTGANFRYTWDTRRGGELTCVEQHGLRGGGWWTRGSPRISSSTWQRVNSTFAWKLLDTIPALSFANSRGAYYSLEWKIAYASADRDATLTIVLSVLLQHGE